MNGLAKLAVKVALVLTGSILIGYTEYRLKGGEPVHKLYKDVKAERISQAAAKAKMKGYIVTEGTVK